MTDRTLGAVLGGVEAVLIISAAIVILDTYFGTRGTARRGAGPRHPDLGQRRARCVDDRPVPDQDDRPARADAPRAAAAEGHHRPVVPGIIPKRAVGNRSASRGVSPGPMLDSPSLRIAVRRDPPTVEDLRSTTVTDDPVQRRDIIPARASQRWRPRRVQRPGHALPGPAVRPRRADGPGSRPGVRCRPGGVLLGVPQPDLVPWRERQVLAQPDLRQRGDGPAAGEEAPARPAVSRSSTTRRWQPPAGIEADPERTALDSERTRDPRARPGRDHRRPARRDRPVRRRGLRLRRDRRDDRGLARDRQVAHPPRPAGAPRRCSRTGWSCSVADAGRASRRSRSRARREPARWRPRRARISRPRSYGSPPARRARRSTRISSRCRRPPAPSRRPARPRDFRLTAADAARLRAEPVGDDARLTGVMTDLDPAHPRTPPTTPTLVAVAGRPFAAADRAGRRRGARRGVQRLRGPPRRPRCSGRRDPRDADPAPPDRLHADPRPRRATASEPVASARRGRSGSSRDGVTRPLAIGSDRARARRAPRRVGADHPPTAGGRRWQRGVEPGRRRSAPDRQRRPGVGRRPPTRPAAGPRPVPRSRPGPRPWPRRRPGPNGPPRVRTRVRRDRRPQPRRPARRSRTARGKGAGGAVRPRRRQPSARHRPEPDRPPHRPDVERCCWSCRWRSSSSGWACSSFAGERADSPTADAASGSAAEPRGYTSIRAH